MRTIHFDIVVNLQHFFLFFFQKITFHIFLTMRRCGERIKMQKKFQIVGFNGKLCCVKLKYEGFIFEKGSPA